MQTRSFIENIAELELNDFLSLKANLEGVFCDLQLRDLLVALGVIPDFGAALVQESDLRQQLGVISDLLSHITRVEPERCWVKLGEQSRDYNPGFDTPIPLENSVFQYFLSPETQANALQVAAQGEQRNEEQLQRGDISDNGVDIGASEDQPLLQRPANSPSVIGRMRNFVRRTPGDYSNASREREAIENQQRFLNSLGSDKLNRLRTVLENLGLRYPGEGRAQSPVKRLASFAQLLVVLMADALVQLNVWLNQQEYRAAIESNRDYDQLISNITVLAARLASNGQLVPHIEQIQDLQSQQSIEQFLGHLASVSHPVTPKGAGPRTPNDASLRMTSAEGSIETVVNTSSPSTNNSRPNDAPLYPMPAYLAKSFQACLAEAIEDDVSRVKKRSLRGSPNDKAAKMSGVAKVLRGQDPQMTFWDIYNHTQSGDGSLLAILREKRNAGPGNEATSFGKTLFNAGSKFLAKNPASLMRRYVYLTQLSAFVNFRDYEQEQFHQAHLKKTINQMSTLRKAMRVLYWNTFSFTDVQKHMTQLISLARQDSSIAGLVRLFCVACLDKMNEQEFGRLALSTKNWLLEGFTSLNKGAFINVIAQGMRDVRGVEKALLEIASFQQARYKTLFDSSAYTVSEHQTKIETVAIHLGACLDNYFGQPNLEKASVIDLQLLQPEISAHASGEAEEYKGDDSPSSSQVQNTLGANSSTHKTKLRLITNLELHWQAVLASNVGSITATTLALVNSRDIEALGRWVDALSSQASETESPELRANLLILRDLFDGAGQKKIFFSPPEFMKQENINPENVKPYNQKFDERMLDYKAIIAFVDVLLNHLQYDLNSSAQKNEQLTTLFKLAFAVLDNLADDESVLYFYNNAFLIYELDCICEELPKSMEPSIDNAQTLVAFLEEMEGGFHGEKAQAKLRELFPPNSEAISRINLIKTKTEKIQELKVSMQYRRDRLLSICYPVQTNSMGDANQHAGDVEVSASIKAIREAVYGTPENIINPNVGVPFRHEFTTAIRSRNHDFFIKALFTPSHHLIKPAGYEKRMCSEIATSLRGQSSADIWGALGENFYGNGDALQALFRDYYSLLKPEAPAVAGGGAGRGGEEEAPVKPIKTKAENALRIAIFGFSHTLFKNFKATFARDIVLTLEKITADLALELLGKFDIRLVDVLATLVNASDIISAEEKTAINALKEVVERLGGKSLINHHRVLSVRAARHAVLCTKNQVKEMPTHLLGFPLNGAQHATHVDNLIKGLDNLSVTSDAQIINNSVPVKAAERTPVAIQDEFDRIIYGLVDGAFPEKHPVTQGPLRYFLTGHRSDTNKLTRHQLREMLWGHIKKLQEGKQGHIDSFVLQQAIERLHNQVDATFQEENQTKQWVENKIAQAMSTNHAELREAEVRQKRTVLEPVTSTDAVFFDKKTLPSIVKGIANHLEQLVREYGAQEGPILERREETGGRSRMSRRLTWRLSRTRGAETVPSGALVISGEITEEKIRNAVAVAEKWLLSGEEAPTKNNIPMQISTLIDAAQLTQERINELRKALIKAGIENRLERRINFIRANRSDLCLEDIKENLRTESELSEFKEKNPTVENLPDAVTADVELRLFIYELKEKADSDLAQYQSCLDAFIWSLAQAGANEQVAAEAEAEAEAAEAAEGSNQPPLNSKLEILKAFKYDWDYLIFLGCKHYAGMKPAERSQTGAPLLKALVYFAKNLANLVEDEEMRRIDAFINEVSGKVQAKHPSLSEIQRHKKVKHYIRNALLGVQGEIENFITTGSTDFKISSVGDRQTYAAYCLIKALRDKQITQNDVDVYYAIYTLTQAHALRASSEEDEDRDLDEDHLEDSADVDDISSKATDLLNRFNKQLEDEKYAQWHREILPLSQQLPSSIDRLIRHKPYDDANIQRKLDHSHIPDILINLQWLEAKPYYWQTSINKIYLEHFAYEAHAVYELQKLLYMKEFNDEPLNTQYFDEDGKLQHQHNHQIEQQALAFMAAKYFLDDDEKEGKTDTTAPFTEAIRLIAAASQERIAAAYEKIIAAAYQEIIALTPEESIALTREKIIAEAREKIIAEARKETIAEVREKINAEALRKVELDILADILEKACQSFNRMLNTKDMHAYGLNRTKNVSLKREIMGWNNLGGRRVKGWIESYDFIKQVYIQTTLESGVSSEEQADFVLQLLSGEVSQVSVTDRPDSVRSEDAFSLNSTPATNRAPSPPAELAVAQENDDFLDNRMQLLFMAFDCKYKQINLALQVKSLLSRDLLSEPLKIFMQQIGKYNLWQEYYAYIESKELNHSNDFAEFAQYTTVQNPRHLIVHANEIFDALTSKTTPCDDRDTRFCVMRYILKSWCSAFSDSQIKTKFLREFSDSPQCLYNNVIVKCFRQFESGQTNPKDKKEFSEQFHNEVPQEIQELLFSLANHLGVHAKQRYTPPGNSQENGRGSGQTIGMVNPMHQPQNQRQVSSSGGSSETASVIANANANADADADANANADEVPTAVNPMHEGSASFSDSHANNRFLLLSGQNVSRAEAPRSEESLLIQRK